MITANLIKELEKKGFELEFPLMHSNEEIIISILKSNNSRLYTAIPLYLKEKINYRQIISKLNQEEIKNFNKIILITNKIFIQEKIDNTFLIKLIKERKIKSKINSSTLNYFHQEFNEALKRMKKQEEEKLKKNIEFRSQLSINKSLTKIYSPGKIRIMKKIFNHEQLTNTELKYYYRSIRPLIIAILNKDMRNYLKIIESTKKLY